VIRRHSLCPLPLVSVLSSLLVPCKSSGTNRSLSTAFREVFYNVCMERLNKYLAHAGVGSRRHCDALIARGRVKVDGRVVITLGVQINPETQQVAVDDHPVRAEKFVYWLVNKPQGYLCTNSDPGGRPRAIDLLPHVDQRVYAVGRLDEASEGLLLMTNDGELAFQLMHPKYGVTKSYLVQVAGRPTTEDVQKLLDGVWLAEGKVKAKSVRRMKPQGNSTWMKIVLNEGKNREIRRMLAKLDHKVLLLRRVAIGPIELDRLPRGKARKLSLAEVEKLKREVTKSKLNADDSSEPEEPKDDGNDKPALLPRKEPPIRNEAKRPPNRNPAKRAPSGRPTGMPAMPKPQQGREDRRKPPIGRDPKKRGAR